MQNQDIDVTAINGLSLRLFIDQQKLSKPQQVCQAKCVYLYSNILATPLKFYDPNDKSIRINQNLKTFFAQTFVIFISVINFQNLIFDHFKNFNLKERIFKYA